MLETVAVPTVVPPEQLAGADPRGPKTVIVIVPVGLYPEASTELIKFAVIFVPRVPVDGAVAVSVGEAWETTVFDIPEPQVLPAVKLLESPP